MTRAEAIEELAQNDLRNMPPKERAEQLETMALEDWSDSPGWSQLSAEVRAEFEGGEEIRFEPSSSRYDAVLLLWLCSRYAGVTNTFLQNSLRKLKPSLGDVAGTEEQLFPCPCCGRNSLSELNSYDICGVCWWEDDGQDNSKADTVMGGPNYGVSLTQGRVNFILHGISDPSRNDLRALQDPSDKYAIGRVFGLAEDGKVVEEPSAGWKSRTFK